MVPPLNKADTDATRPSMSTRAGTTRAQIKSMAKADLDEMATQLDAWGAQVADFAVHAGSAGANSASHSMTDHHESINDLKTKYAVARARLDDFKTAGGAQWQIFRSDIERAWNDFETALDRLSDSSSTGTQGDHHENPSIA